MRYFSRSVLVGIAAMAMTVASVTVIADPDLDQKMSNPANWAIQAGDYANHRYSDLSQINSAMNTLRRLLETLGIERKPKDITTLEVYLSEQKRKTNGEQASGHFSSD